jgi:alkylation response protein AidB-like acyl-CoA dehydrogenase
LQNGLHALPLKNQINAYHMHFELSEEQRMIQKAARDFAREELLPGVIERDEQQKFPAQQIKKLGEVGFMGMMVDPRYGGGGMDTVSYVLAMEEFSKVDASASVVVSVNNSLVCWGIETFGNEAQKQKYLVPLAKGEMIGAFCLSEPEAGSDATSQRTTAIDMGDHYLLNGNKNWITNKPIPKRDPKASMLLLLKKICRGSLWARKKTRWASADQIHTPFCFRM